MRVAIVATHPIQHFVPFYRRLAAEPDLKLHVFFMSDMSARGYFDELMKTHIAWNMDLLSGYEHSFLPEAPTISKTDPLGLNNPSIVPELKKFGPDLVIVYGYNQVTQFRVLRWCRRGRVPLMMTSDSELLRDRPWWRRAVKGAVLPKLYARYSAFLTTGDHNEDYLAAYGVPKERMFRSPLTIDDDRFRAARIEREPARRRFRSEHGIAEEAFVGVTVGKLTKGKRPTDLLDAAAKLQSTRAGRRPEIRFLAAGDGELRSELEGRIKREGLAVQMLGFVNLDRLPDLYCAADALLHLSDTDAHPLALSEAACIGLPLIVSDKVGAIGPTDIARAEENAIVTPCGDAEAIAAAVGRLADNPDLAARKSAASVRIYSELDMDTSLAGLKSAVAYCLSGDPLRASVIRSAG